MSFTDIQIEQALKKSGFMIQKSCFVIQKSENQFFAVKPGFNSNILIERIDDKTVKVVCLYNGTAFNGSNPSYGFRSIDGDNIATTVDDVVRLVKYCYFE